MTTRRQWSPVLAAVLVTLLLAGSVGPSGAAGVAEPRAINRIITIPAGAFSAADDGYDFHNNGANLYSEAGVGAFAAPLFFESRQVTVNSITLYGFDNNAAYDLCVTLFRTTPWNGNEEEMGVACSNGASANNRTFTETSLALRQVTGSYGPYLWIYFPIDIGLKFYAVRISYSA